MPNAEIVLSSNEEIVKTCASMEPQQKITFVPDHPFEKFENAALCFEIAQEREKNKKEGMVALMKYNDSGVQKVEATCHIVEKY